MLKLSLKEVNSLLKYKIVALGYKQSDLVILNAKRPYTNEEGIYQAYLIAILLENNERKGAFYQRDALEVMDAFYDCLYDAVRKNDEDAFFYSIIKDFELPIENEKDQMLVKSLSQRVFNDAIAPVKEKVLMPHNEELTR